MEIDSKKIAKLALEITARYKHIKDIFPKGNDLILKHLAASSIHMALFMKEFYEILEGDKLDFDDRKLNKFLEECGCNMNGKKIYKCNICSHELQQTHYCDYCALHISEPMEQ